MPPKKKKGKVVDLDALAATRREAAGDGPTVKFGGKTFAMPPELPFVIVEAVGRLEEAGDDDDAQGAAVGAMLGDVSRALFGDKYEEFLKLGPSTNDVMDLIGAVAEAYGTSTGESSASGTS